MNVSRKAGAVASVLVLLAFTGGLAVGITHPFALGANTDLANVRYCYVYHGPAPSWLNLPIIVGGIYTVYICRDPGT